MWKAFVNTVRIKSADLKINFCSRVLRLSVLPWLMETPQTAICCLEWLGRLKFLATGLDTFWSSFSTSRRCSRNRSPSRLPVSPMYNFCKKCKLCSRWHWLRYRWNDQWSWLIAWVSIFYQRCEWNDMFCIGLPSAHDRFHYFFPSFSSGQDYEGRGIKIPTLINKILLNELPEILQEIYREVKL